MKAAVHTEYGSYKNITIDEIEKPKIKDNEVLIEVHACAINSWDHDMITGKPYALRPLFGFFKPRLKIIGCDVAGVVTEVGKNITKFSIGDEVFGDLSESGWGGFAEFVTAKEDAIIAKPKSMSLMRLFSGFQRNPAGVICL